MGNNLIGLVALLAGDDDLAALVGDRIGPAGAGQGEVFPCLVLNRISRDIDHELTGLPTGDDDDRILIAALAISKALAEEIGAEVARILDGRRGLVDLQMRQIFLETEYDDFSPLEGGEGQGIYQWLGNFLVTPI